MPSSAGIRVTATIIPISTASPMPGPNARNVGEPATTSALVPAAAVSPAIATIGDDCAVAQRAAVSRSAPPSICARAADR